ncbi:MAG: signal recognition particle-docking protein FtsY [Chlamydiota bacterium]
MFGLIKSGFSKIKRAFAKTRLLLGDKIRAVFAEPLNEETLDKLEQILFEADLGSKVALEAVAAMRRFARSHPEATTDAFITEMKRFARDLLATPPQVTAKQSAADTPHVILIVGVNGSGKTTTAAKLAHHHKEKKQRTLLVAGDTFRAAAIDQLSGWADKLAIDCVKGAPGGDPSAVIFDALTAAKQRQLNIVIADTAGRLQSKTALMEELAKINRVCTKVISDAPHDTFLVLDATTGQNAIDQAKTFHAFTPLTGLIITKLDGSAKGGIVLSIYRELGIPVRYIGIGEKATDLIPFDRESYIDALFS